jgi:glycosyltransferase involved in cell wall biosynthesis
MQCHVLSFEGPDSYAQGGGLSSRITGLTETLVKAGFETHLWFVGDPHLPGHEGRSNLHLHRWCQWISQHHPAGVYDGEEGKQRDYATSLPPFLFDGLLLPHLKRKGRALLMAEEWHTVDAVFHLDWLLQSNGVREQVAILWNGNNSFGFDRIDWQRLDRVAVITTVSRYMKGLMQRYDVNPIVIPNGLSENAYKLPEEEAIKSFRDRLQGRVILAKVARWDPAKRWLLALETTWAMKEQGLKPLLIARGGSEYYAQEVWRKAAALGLRVSERFLRSSDHRSLLFALEGLRDIDILNLVSPLGTTARGLLLHSSDAVLANSGYEPFGLVGLETMAVKGVACIGNTGEDYAIGGYNALVLETNDPREFLNTFEALKKTPSSELSLRHAGRRTAREYAWPKIIERMLLPRITFLGQPQSLPPVKAA